MYRLVYTCVLYSTFIYMNGIDLCNNTSVKVFICDPYNYMYSLILHTLYVQRGVSLLRATTEAQMQTEVNTLSRFRHPNILPLMGYCIQPPCLVYPLMARRSLFVNLHEYRTIKVNSLCLSV